MGLHAHVDLDVCLVTGTCEAALPELFSLDADGTLQVLQDPVPEHLVERARATAASCPSRALRLQEAREG
jgi:ferredoxin